VDERLSEYLQRGGFGVLLLSLENMDAFRESYGFVAADDVLRAVGVMIINTLRELGTPDDFLGHVSPTVFLLIAPSSNLSMLEEKLRARLEQSLDYFYPIKDREQAAQRDDHLSIMMAGMLPSASGFSDPGRIKTELLRLKR
jgi:GGDEF domain-containing protein